MSSLANPSGWRKLVRFIAIYGPGRALFKAASRLRLDLALPGSRSAPRDVGIVGCGQFAFATIGYFLKRAARHRILACFDIDTGARESLGRAFAVPTVADSVEALLAAPGLRTVYIASNHASHTPYAVQALARGIDVYVEKPIAVSFEQLVALERARRDSRARLFAGYNRPFSAAIVELRRGMPIARDGAVTMQCFVAGHVLAADHWYRRAGEGTRVCGNIGHWLDLFVHVLSWRSLPERLEITIASADPREPDDNLCIAATSERGDLLSVTLSARAEPFEGINETINIQHGETLCKIDDFRRSTVWQGERVRRRRHWPKDVGHRAALMQPFDRGSGREWAEVVASTLLMLHIADMVGSGTRHSTFSFTDGAARLSAAVEPT
ncbi:MAG: Gfo/Idh/MocA family oxidoreductase [Caldimonas sp.]